jgi:hypothetical protein
MHILQKLKGSLYSKTSNFALLTILLGLADQLLPQVAAFVPADYRGLALAVAGVVFWCLRWVTTKPLERK